MINLNIGQDLKILKQHIEVEEMYTPTDWEMDLNVYKGATFNLAHNLPQMMYFRPPNQFKELNHCWLVGGGTHPGSGLPTIMESARITSRMLHEQAELETQNDDWNCRWRDWRDAFCAPPFTKRI